MITALQIAILLILIALIGVILGFLFGKLSCKKQSSASYFEKNDFCENEYPISANLLNSKEEAILENSEENEILNKKEENKEDKKPLTLDAPRNGEADNLCRIKGIGFVIEEKLHNLGIFHFDQIASWTEEEIKWVDKHLAFSGRIIREDWVGQAKKLAAGEETEFSKRVAKGEIATSRKG